MTVLPWLSVVVPTFNGGPRLRRLLEQLDQQSLPAEQFEVIAVDDGSDQPPLSELKAFAPRFSFQLLSQPNRGAAAARDNGARCARAELLVFIDDDMELPRNFLEEHLRQHQSGEPRVVLGQMRAALGPARRGLYERWHQAHLEEREARLLSGAAIRGHDLFSGNVSMRKRDYFAAGGFDWSLRRGHDAELGLRLERIGVPLSFSATCWSRHESEVHDVGWWRGRAALYGRIAARVAAKHPDVPNADPWKLARQMNPGLRPFIRLATRAPSLALAAGALALRVARVFDVLGLSRLALAAVSATYTMDYFRGLKAEETSTRAFPSGRQGGEGDARFARGS